MPNIMFIVVMAFCCSCNRDAKVTVVLQVATPYPRCIQSQLAPHKPFHVF